MPWQLIENNSLLHFQGRVTVDCQFPEHAKDMPKNTSNFQ